MPPPPSEPDDSAARHQAGSRDDLTALRRSIESIDQRLGELGQQNGELRRQLQHSETARADLLAQTEHLIELLARSQRELRELRGDKPTG